MVFVVGNAIGGAARRTVAAAVLVWCAAGCRSSGAAGGEPQGPGSAPAPRDAGPSTAFDGSGESRSAGAASDAAGRREAAIDGAIDTSDDVVEAPPSATGAIHDAGTRADSAAGAFAPCGDPPEGMVCIPGGPFLRGADNGDPDERPATEVILSTFYIDRYEVTNARFAECVEAGACSFTRRYEGFMDPDQPAVAVDWYRSAAYCEWAGKRLPTEAEWEKAARGTDGRTFPWGDDDATCARAAYRGCDPDRTRPVGSFPAGAWGVHDMAGNAFEFVQDWYSPCYRGCRGECGDECEGVDPRGPCAGAAECPGRDKRVLRGGSWYWGASWMRTTNRRPMRPDHAGHRLGFRCALSVLTPPGPPTPDPDPVPDPGTGIDVRDASPPVDEAPPRLLEATPEAPVPPMTDRERAIFLAVPQEVLARSPVDKRHYVKSNEPHHHHWFAFIDGIGGGYMGVGADQNYTLFARARSEFVWLMDYDVVVTRAHRIYRAFIIDAPTPAEFVAYWHPGAYRRGVETIEAACANDADLADLRTLYHERLPELRAYFSRVRGRDVGGYPATWLADPALYRYVRRMFAEDRVRIVTGDLLGTVMVAGIARAHRELGVPMRVVYLSNAEQYFSYNDAFREAFAAMPFDDESVILRTVSLEHPDRPRRVWHYQVQPATHFVALLGPRGIDRAADLRDDAVGSVDGGLSLVALGVPE